MALMKLINRVHANKSMMTGFGKISFNEAGEAEVEEVVAAALKTLKGFSVEEVEQEDGKTEGDEDFSEKESEPINLSESGQQEDESEEDSEVEDEAKEAEVEETESSGEVTEYTFEELDGYNVAQLKKIAGENGIDTKNLTKKAQLIDAILSL